jgi:hypothetical protein
MSRPWTGAEIVRLRKLAANGVRAREVAVALGRCLGAATVVDRWHNQPPIMRRIELAGCIARPQLVVCLAPAHS